MVGRLCNWSSRKSLPLRCGGEEVLTAVLSVKLKITVSASTHFKTSTSSVCFIFCVHPSQELVWIYIQAQLRQLHKTLQI